MMGLGEMEEMGEVEEKKDTLKLDKKLFKDIPELAQAIADVVNGHPVHVVKRAMDMVNGEIHRTCDSPKPGIGMMGMSLRNVTKPVKITIPEKAKK